MTWQILWQETIVARHISMVALQNYCTARQKAFSQTIEQLSHHKILALSNIKAWFRLVRRIVRVGDFYDLLRSGILTISVNTPFQTSQTVGNFYDECEHKICLSGTVADDRDFYDKCEHEICMSGTSGMLDFVFICYQSLIFSKLSMYNLKYCSQKLSTKKHRVRRQSELCLKLYSVERGYRSRDRWPDTDHNA